MKKAFIIMPVKNLTPQEYTKILAFVDKLESKGFKVHVPKKDTNQNGTSINICTTNLEAIKEANEVFIYYNSNSIGSVFDLGCVFSLNKKLTAINNIIPTEGKSFTNLIIEYINKNNREHLS